jgi:hypothetical protein
MTASTNVVLAYFEKATFISAADGRQPRELSRFKFLFKHPLLIQHSNFFTPRRILDLTNQFQEISLVKGQRIVEVVRFIPPAYHALSSYVASHFVFCSRRRDKRAGVSCSLCKVTSNVSSRWGPSQDMVKVQNVTHTNEARLPSNFRLSLMAPSLAR